MVFQRIALTVLSVFLYSISFAQPANDNFASAIALIHSSNKCSANGAYTSVNATADLNSGSCWENGPNYNVWFKFVATTTDITLDLKVGGSEGTMDHPNMALWEVDGITQISCVRRIDASTDVQISTAQLTIGNTYYVSVDNYVGLGYRGTFTLCIDNTVTYDDISGAIILTHSANNCSADAAYSTVNATSAPGELKGSCWENGPNYTRWFKFVATTIAVTLDLKVGGAEGTMDHPNMALWEVDGITQISCVRRIDASTDVQISTAQLTIGNTYYVSVDNYVGLGYRGTFTLCIDNTVTYDDISGAIILTHSANNCSADAAYSTVNATSAPGELKGSCWENGPNYTRWFKFVATTIAVTLDLKVGGAEGTMDHPNMALWEVDGITQISCVRRIDASTDVQISTAQLTIGNTYYVSVDNYVGLGYRGTFTLCIDNTVTYDDISGAILLPDINNWCSLNAAYTTVNATSAPSELKGSCWENGPNYTRWFKFVATTQFITLDLKTGGSEGTMDHPNMALWETDGTTEVACVRRVDASTDVQIVTNGLTIGNTYFISVDNYVGLGYRGTFTLCADDQPSYDYYEGAIELTDLNNWCSADAAYTTINATSDLNKGGCWENGANYNRWFKFTAISSNVTVQMKVAGSEGTLDHPNMALWDSDGTTELACVRRVDATTDVSISYASLTIGQTYYVSCDNYVGLGYRGSFTLCINNIDGTFYSRTDGPWTTNSTWSTVAIGGAAASDYPQAGDVANIEGYTITISGTSENAAEVNINTATLATGLALTASAALDIAGRFNITNPGNNLNTAISITNSALSVNDVLTINRNGGTATLDLTIDNSTLLVNRDFEVYSTSGTNNNTISLINGASLTITEDALLSNTGGPKTFLNNDASTVTFTQNLTLTASVDDKIELALTNAGVLNVKKDIVRGTPAYGILNSASGTTVNFNSTDNLQIFPHSTGSGTGDTFTYQNVVINNSRITSPQLTLDGDVIINESLTLTDGEILTTSSNLLTLAAGSSVSGATVASFVDGPIKKIGNTDFEFPIGDQNFWQPIGIANLTGDAATEFTAQYFEQTPTDNLNMKSPDPNGDMNNISGLEYWDITNTGTASNADVTLFWKDQTRSDIDNGLDLQIAHYDGSEWENLGQTSINFTDPGSITVTGVTTFSPFSFGSLSGSFNALPIELISFEAKKNLASIELTWATATEFNNDFFIIEKSMDADQWLEIVKVAGQGNSTSRVDYSFTDEYPFKGNQYYRLKQVDYDGSFSYSKIILVNHPGSNKIAFNLYPNPVQDDILYIQSPTLVKVDNVFLIDINGRTTEIFHQVLNRGEYQISLSGLSGVYVVVINTPNGQFRQKILKL